MPHSSFAQFLSELTSGPVTAVAGAQSCHAATCTLAEGQTIEVDEEVFDYFLDVLPPRYQGRGCFAFAEGAEPFRFFWRRGGKYFCRLLSWAETQEFLRLAKGGDYVA